MLKKLSLWLLLFLWSMICEGQNPSQSIPAFYTYTKGEGDIFSPRTAADSAVMNAYIESLNLSFPKPKVVIPDSSQIVVDTTYSPAQQRVLVDSVAWRAWKDTVQPKADIMQTYVLVLPLSDTTGVASIAVKIGLTEEGNDLFSHTFTYDSYSGLPEGCIYNREGKIVYIEIVASSKYNSRKYFTCTILDSNNQAISTKKYDKY